MVTSYVHGRSLVSDSSDFFSLINPATNEEIDKVQIPTKSEIEKAVESAKEGFFIWKGLPPAERSKVLMKCANLLRERNEEIALVEVEDTGKPIAEAIEVDVLSGADAIEYFAGLVPYIHGHQFDLGKSFAYTRKEPLGICAGIGAWNYPVQIACWKSAPALAAGNAMIFKPAELTPRSALLLAETYSEAGLPDGVFNVLQGGPEVGRALVSHTAVAKVSLTGEVSTGIQVMQAAAATLKSVTLELGGKSPLIVFSDADLEQAVDGALLANFYTQGEICSNGTRVFVQKEIKAKFLDLIVEKTKKIKIGDPKDPETQLGALISKDHLNKVQTYIEKGKAESTLIYGGNRVNFPEGSRLSQGNFIEPAIFDCDDHCTIAKEEIFGPVLSLLTFDDEKDVISRANKTPYGLAAGVFTKDLQRAHRVVHQLQAGVCWINNYNITPVQLPFGGYKMSGIGRENGLAALDHYTQIKTIYVEMEKINSPYL